MIPKSEHRFKFGDIVNDSQKTGVIISNCGWWDEHVQVVWNIPDREIVWEPIEKIRKGGVSKWQKIKGWVNLRKK